MANTNVLDQPTTQQQKDTAQGTSQTGTPGGQQGTQQNLSRQSQASGLSRRGSYDPWLGGPFSILRQMGDEMDRLFSEFLNFGSLGRGRQSLGRSAPTGLATWMPQIEIFERGDQLVVRADLPGMKREDLQIEVQDGALVLQGERRSEHEENREGLYRSERSYGSFYRAIPLPEGVNPDDVHGNFKEGVLEVHMPLPKRQSRGRRIELQEGSAGSVSGAAQGSTGKAAGSPPSSGSGKEK
jgi:HSP20 family protein